MSENAKDRRAMDSALCSFFTRWKLDGDYLRCAKCKRPHLASRIELEFSHAARCPLADTNEPQPWLALTALLHPISGSSEAGPSTSPVPHEKAPVPASSPVAPQAEPVAFDVRFLAARVRRVMRAAGIPTTEIDKDDEFVASLAGTMLGQVAGRLENAAAAPQGDGLLRLALEALDDLGDDAAAHMLPADVERCSRSECTATVYSVRVSTPAERTQPLFTREQVEAALRQYLPKDPA